MTSRKLTDTAVPSAGWKRQHGDKDMLSNWSHPPRPGEKSPEQGRPYMHRQLGVCRLSWSGRATRGATRGYAAMATPVTSAQVVKAWVRPNRRFAAVSWSRRRGKTLAT